MQVGTRLGAYEITAKLGEGGMGEVYRATDSNLGRQVAIKVLPAAFATDAERLARFEREARTLASLNHPNIAGVHGLDRSHGVALVMELVEGPTLADRLAHGPLSWVEARPIAEQIAHALDAAHEQGIVHRDLKPANIKVRDDGTVKVLDFGLAKAVEPVGAALSGMTHSPTITSPAMTAAGVLLGTAAYMSPEQARARAVDKRTDIWAFGAVLYEMLTGRRAFAGDDVSEVLASVLAREPDWSALPAGLPPAIVTVIRRCLEKDRKQRIRDIGDVALVLHGAFDPVAASRAAAVAPSLWRRALPVAAAAILAALATGLAAWLSRPIPEPRLVTRFEYTAPDGLGIFTVQQRPLLTISPDGRSIAYLGRQGLYVRSLGETDARLLAGVQRVQSGPQSGTAAGFNEGLPFNPFFSVDGEWVGFFVLGQMKKVSVAGGTPVMVCAAAPPLGASWSADNTILFGQGEGIMRVSADGGTPEVVVKAGENEALYGPQLMPDGRSVLFTVTTDNGPARWDQAKIVVQSLSTGARTAVVTGGSEARYLATGHLVYVLRDELFAVPFDARRLTVTGGARPLVQGLLRPTGVSAMGANYGVSSQGTLVYASRAVLRRSPVWMNRQGAPPEPITAIPPGAHEDPRLSPDGSRVLLTRDGDIWNFEIASGRNSRVTRDGVSQMAVWDPTGSYIAYSSGRGGNLEAWVASSDGSGEPRQVTTLGGQIHVDSWSPDGALVALHRHAPEGSITDLHGADEWLRSNAASVHRWKDRE